MTTKIATSLRQLDEKLRKAVKDGDKTLEGELLVRNNSYILPLDRFYIEPGFNIRELDDEHVRSFADAFKRGADVPRLTVQLVLVDGVEKAKLIDGHHRFHGARLAVSEGATLRGLSVEEFTGNAADAITLMITSTQGRELTMLQRAEAYKRLSGQHFSNAEIATRVGRTPQNVEQLLLLANAEESVKQLVRDNKVSGSSAIEAVRAQRQGGEDAYEALLRMISGAVKAGAARATPKHDKAKSPSVSRKVVASVVTSLATDEVRSQLRSQVEKGGQATLALSPEQAQKLLELLEAGAAKPADAEAGAADAS